MAFAVAIIAIVLMLVIIAVGGFLPCSKLSSGLAYWFATGIGLI